MKVLGQIIRIHPAAFILSTDVNYCVGKLQQGEYPRDYEARNDVGPCERDVNRGQSDDDASHRVDSHSHGHPLTAKYIYIYIYMPQTCQIRTISRAHTYTPILVMAFDYFVPTEGGWQLMSNSVN